MYMHTYIEQQSSNSSSSSTVLLLLYVRVMLAVLLCHCVYCLLYVHEYSLLLWSVTVYRLPIRLPAKSALTFPVV